MVECVLSQLKPSELCFLSEGFSTAIRNGHVILTDFSYVLNSCEHGIGHKFVTACTALQVQW